MKKLTSLIFFLAATQAHASGMEGSDPLVFKGMINHLEQRYSNDGNDSTHWDAEAWLGRDINKLWLKTEGERHDGEIENHRVQLLYNRAISSYWDVQLGIAHDITDSPSENWLALGIHGTAPFFVDTESSMLVGDNGHATWQLKLAQEWMLTQRLILEPELAMSANNKTSVPHAQGKGLSQVEFSLRMHYEIRREFAPYIGISGQKLFGDTKTLRNDGGSIDTTVGIAAWF